MAATILSIDLIASDPNVRGGRPCIAGTGIRVSDVAMVMLFHTQDTSEIAAWFDVSLAQIHAALAYYYAHKADIDADMRDSIARGKAYKEQRVGGRRKPLLPG